MWPSFCLSYALEIEAPLDPGCFGPGCGGRQDRDISKEPCASVTEEDNVVDTGFQD
jgi:hypothetical protein